MATPNALQCQDDLVLQRLLAEQLSEAEESVVLAHIESCEVCRDRLAALAGHGELAPEIREHFSSGVYQDPGEETLFQSDVESGSEVAEVEQIKTLLGPTDDPHMLGRIGHYEINGVVGRGSTGIVFKALDKRLNRFVAIKMLAPSYAGSGATRQRFEREA
ncbi:MAG: serine/threonine protein kinase, partial [Planctomycetota bacterium]